MSTNLSSSSLREDLNGTGGKTQGPFDLLRQRMDDILGDEGIFKEVVRPGVGLPVPTNASVLMKYSGFLEYSHIPFETNSHKKYPRMKKLGRDVTLYGLELGLMTMQKGEFSRFIIEPQYAYGDMGCPPLIPPGARVLFEVHVVDYLDSGQVDFFVEMSPEQQNTVSLSLLLEVVNTLRRFGNHCFAQRRYWHAKDRYKEALLLLKNREMMGWDDSEQEKINTALLPLYLNLSLNELRLEFPKKALKYGKKALEIDSTNTKALYRCGQAYLELKEFEIAQEYLVAAQAKKPFDEDINGRLKELSMQFKDSFDKEKDMCLKMFKDLAKL